MLMISEPFQSNRPTDIQKKGISIFKMKIIISFDLICCIPCKMYIIWCLQWKYFHHLKKYKMLSNLLRLHQAHLHVLVKCARANVSAHTQTDIDTHEQGEKAQSSPINHFRIQSWLLKSFKYNICKMYCGKWLFKKSIRL